MKLVASTGEEMIEVASIETQTNSLVMRVNVMRSMNMSVVLTPTELRRGLKMVSVKLILQIILMLFKR